MPSRAHRVAVSVLGSPSVSIDRRVVTRRLLKMLAHLQATEPFEIASSVEVSVVLASDEAMRDMNRDYRGIDRPTDVLAFALEEGMQLGSDDDGHRILGDVVVAMPTADRQARDNNRTLLAEATMLLAHGLLHLCGYDHATKPEERVMVARTQELEKAAGRRAS